MSLKNQIQVCVNGPLLCTGDIELYMAEGELLEKTKDVALCRCGASKNKPYCDGSHKEAGFEDDSSFTDDRAEALEDDGPLQISIRPDAMLVAKGTMQIVSSDGTCSTTRNRAALCRCGCSEHKPFCDASHKHCGLLG